MRSLVSVRIHPQLPSVSPPVGWILRPLGGRAGNPEWAPCLRAGCGPGSSGTWCPRQAWQATAASTPPLAARSRAELAPPSQPVLLSGQTDRRPHLAGKGSGSGSPTGEPNPWAPGRKELKPSPDWAWIFLGLQVPETVSRHQPGSRLQPGMILSAWSRVLGSPCWALSLVCCCWCVCVHPVLWSIPQTGA